MNYEKIINSTISKNKLIKINEKIYLTKEQIEILKKYQIPYHCNSLNELIFYIEEILQENPDFEDLENLSLSLAEIDYYSNYRK